MRPHPTRRARSLAALGFALATLVGAAATAQPAPGTPAPTPTVADPNADTARRYFEAGVSAMQRQDWAEAVNGFENSERLRRTASVSLNLGIARHRLGRLIEARAALNDFLQNATPAQHGEHDAEVGRLVAEIGRRVGRIRLTELRPTSSTVTIDGHAAVFNDAREVTVNPGEHRLRAEAEGFVSRDETVRLAEGATQSVALVLVPVAAVAVAPPSRPEPAVTAPAPAPESRSILSRWWFWTGVGVVAAGATVGVVLATRGTNTTVVLPTSSTRTVVQGVAGGLSW
jgi:hypothetical protein